MIARTVAHLAPCALPRIAVAVVLMGVIGLGVHSPDGPEPAEAATVTVRVGDIFFCDPASTPCAQPHGTTISVGDTVTWEWGPGGAGTGLSHTTSHCADNLSSCLGPREWDSTPVQTSGTFSHSFGLEDEGGTFLYRCQVHPLTMQGSIAVQFSGDNDTDGLSNLKEASLGTNPNNPDSDGDTLNDGQEVNVHGTNPLLADTDADQFDDSREVYMGTLPLVKCPGTATAGDEDPDAWPVDFDDNRTVDISDVLALKPVFGASVPSVSARFDLTGGGSIDISDVLALKPLFGSTCS